MVQKVARVAYMMFIILISGCGASPDHPDTSTPDFGAEGVLSDGSDNVTITKDEATQDALIQDDNAHDSMAALLLLDSGKVYMAPTKTKARFIEYGSGAIGFTKAHVRIESGAHNEEDGWVPIEYFKHPDGSDYK